MHVSTDFRQLRRCVTQPVSNCSLLKASKHLGQEHVGGNNSGCVAFLHRTTQSLSVVYCVLLLICISSRQMYHIEYQSPILKAFYLVTSSKALKKISRDDFFVWPVRNEISVEYQE